MNNSIISKLTKYENIIKTHTIPELVHYDWNKLAFGFSSDDILEIPISKINIKWHGDMENVIGSDMGSYFKNTQYSELPPIDVSFDGTRFYLEDGHHRYGYAHKLGIKRVPVKVDITANPFIKLGFTIDDVVNYKKQVLTESHFISFLDQIKSYDTALIESIKSAYYICFENSESDESITNEYESRWNMWKLSITKSGNEIAYLIYALNPITAYTTSEGRDPQNFINIEMIHTDDKYKRMGYASKLMKELLNIKADKFPDKQIIARGNELSRDLLRKFGIQNLSL